MKTVKHYHRLADNAQKYLDYEYGEIPADAFHFMSELVAAVRELAAPLAAKEKFAERIAELRKFNAKGSLSRSQSVGQEEPTSS